MKIISFIFTVGGSGNVYFQMANFFSTSSNNIIFLHLNPLGDSSWNVRYKDIATDMGVKESKRVRVFQVKSAFLSRILFRLFRSVSNFNTPLFEFYCGLYQDTKKYGVNIKKMASLLYLYVTCKVAEKSVFSFSDTDCLVHYRGGDFNGSKNHFVLGSGYYERSLCAANISDYKFISINPEEFLEFFPCAEQFHSPRIRGATSEMADLAAMLHVPFLVASNSTLCWWAVQMRLLFDKERNGESIVVPSRYSLDKSVNLDFVDANGNLRVVNE